MRSDRLLLIGIALSTLLGCGEELLVATFTSEVVQRRTCRVEGTRDEEWSREAKVIRVAPQVSMAWEEVSEGRTAEPMKTRS